MAQPDIWTNLHLHEALCQTHLKGQLAWYHSFPLDPASIDCSGLQPSDIFGHCLSLWANPLDALAENTCTRMITCLSIRKLYKSSKFYPSPTSHRSSSHHLFPRSLQAVFYPKPWGVVMVGVSCELVFLTCLGNCVQRYAEQVYIIYNIHSNILLFTYTCSLIKEKLYMLEFVREIQTRGIHSNSILLLVPQSWRVWTSIITLCSSSRCLCIYICFFKQLPVESLARFRVSTTWFEGWSGEGRGERRKTRKTSGTDLGEGRCHFFPFEKQGASKVHEVSPLLRLFFFGSRKGTNEKALYANARTAIFVDGPRDGNPAARFQ